MGVKSLKKPMVLSCLPSIKLQLMFNKAQEITRAMNTAEPTTQHRDALEKSIASIENGKYGLAFGSGLAAIDAILKLLEPGDEVISTNDLYGGSYRLFTKIFEKFAIKFHFTGMNEVDNIERLINSKTKLIWVETPTNPMMNVVDVKKISSLTKSKKILLVVDNTFATPYLQQPLELGADIVMHSATKYLAGHSDVILGCLALNNKDLAEKLYFIQNASGAICGPMDSFLTLRGIKTLHVRMKRHCENARKIADYLSQNPKISKVYWPGLEDHINHSVAKKQMSDYGAMISFVTANNDSKKAIKIIEKLKIFTLAESLGVWRV